MSPAAGSAADRCCDRRLNRLWWCGGSEGGRQPKTVFVACWRLGNAQQPGRHPTCSPVFPGDLKARSRQTGHPAVGQSPLGGCARDAYKGENTVPPPPRDVLERPYTVAGGGYPPPRPPPPPPLPMFEADSQNFCFGAFGAKRIEASNFMAPPSAGTIGGPWEEGGGGSHTPLPPPPSDPPPLFKFVPAPRHALEGRAPQRQPEERVDGRLQAVAKAVGGGYCRLQMPLRLALGVRGTVSGHRLGTLT